MIIPAFCLTHMESYDRADRFGCVECYAENMVAEIDDDADDWYKDDRFDNATLEAKQEIKETFDSRLDEAINQIMKHIDDCVKSIDDREDLMGGIEAELKEFFDDCVTWS